MILGPMRNTTNMSEKTYNIPVIPPDLRREETIRQICNALDYLDQVADDVFSRISSRVGENHSRLKTINDRVNLAQAKIDQIKGSSKATKVFSGAKYPAVKEEESYKSVFNGPNDKLVMKNSNYKVHSKHQPVDDKVLKEKLQFYNVQLNLKKNQTDGGSHGEGLGRLPENMPSISSLLLFNTTENPYKKYVMLDPLGVVTKTRTTFEDQGDGLADAPSTITHREELTRQTTENFFYMPGLGTVPEIAVPDFLPDLGGVADDVLFSSDQDRSIAPSVPGSNMPDLPSVVPDVETIPSGPAAIGSGGPPPPPGPPSGGPPPPPPPPPPGNIPPPPPPPSVPPPPPPPPPVEAPPPPPGPPPAQGEAPPAAPAGAAAPDTGRAGLLDAIRNAGGAGKAKLRNAKDRKIESKKKKQEEREQTVSSSGGGDLMSDLAMKLQMRRKGISGTGKPGDGGEDGSKSGGVMGRISAMIPPPPKPDSGRDGDEEHDWK